MTKIKYEIVSKDQGDSIELKVRLVVADDGDLTVQFLEGGEWKSWNYYSVADGDWYTDQAPDLT